MGDLYFLCDKIKEGFNFVIEFYFYDIFNRVGYFGNSLYYI